MSRQILSADFLRVVLPALLAASLWAINGTSGRADEEPHERHRLALGSMVPAGILQSGNNTSVHLFGAPKGAHVLDGRVEVVADNDYEAIDVTGWLLSRLSLELPNGISAPIVISLVTSAPGVTGPSGPMLHVVIDTEGRVHRLSADETATSGSHLDRADEIKPASPSAVLPPVQSAAPAVEPTISPSGPAEREASSIQATSAWPPPQPIVEAAPAAIEPISPPKPSPGGVPMIVGLATAPAASVPERAAVPDRNANPGAIEPLLPPPEPVPPPVAAATARTGATTAFEAHLPSASPALAATLIPIRPEAFVQAPSPPLRPADLPSDGPRQPPAPAPTLERPTVPAQSPTENNLVPRAEQMMRQGDISSARLLLERAMSSGDAKAAFLLAQTYDPRALRAWNVRGMRGDPDRARELYGKARQSGFSSAP